MRLVISFFLFLFIFFVSFLFRFTELLYKIEDDSYNLVSLYFILQELCYIVDSYERVLNNVHKKTHIGNIAHS